MPLRVVSKAWHAGMRSALRGEGMATADDWQFAGTKRRLALLWTQRSFQSCADNSPCFFKKKKTIFSTSRSSSAAKCSDPMNGCRLSSRFSIL